MMLSQLLISCTFLLGIYYIERVLGASKTHLDVKYNSNGYDAESRPGGFAAGNASVSCLRCLCLALSGCRDQPCTVNSGILSCGYFHLTKDAWLDCGHLGAAADWRACTHDVTCASLCVQNYIAKYSEAYGCQPTCESYVRIIYGGPNGCNLPTTVNFWHDVRQQPGCKGLV